MPKLRILDLRDSPWVDGPGRTILDCAASVDPARCEILVAAFTQAGATPNNYVLESERRGLMTLPIMEKGALDPAVIGQLLRIVSQYSIDILHTHDFRSDLYGLICAKRTGKPLVSTCHGWIANSTKGHIYTALDKFLLKFFDRIITVSALMKENLIRIGLKSDRIIVLQNALVLDNYRPDVTDRRFRSELGVGDTTQLIANIGRLSPEKGQDIFLDAAQELLRTHRDLRFVLIGRGPEEAALRRRVEALGISEHVVFSGYRPDMHSVYNSLDLIVQSSYTEGMPNVVLEALLMEKPVVATDVGGTREIITSGETGILIRPHSLSELVEAIDAFIQDPAPQRAMAVRGRQVIRDHFNHDKRVARLMDVYENLFNGVR